MAKKRRKPMGGKGKRKGGEFERKVCKDLSLWWTSGARDDVFWRTHNSGGRASVRKIRGKHTAGQFGDICSTDPCSECFTKVLTVETKIGYGRASIADLLEKTDDSAEQIYEKWIKQAVLEQRSAGVFAWLLIHKKPFRETVLIMPEQLYSRLKRRFIGTAPVVRAMIEIRDLGCIRITCLLYETWLSQVAPKDIEQIGKGI